MSDERAQQLLLSRLQGRPLTAPRPLRFVPGQRHEVWRRNCVAIGLSSGFIEPLESTSIHLIQRGAIRLLQTFPSMGIAQADVDEYNRQAQAEIEHIRDFIILHYHVTERDDSEFWRACRALELPPALAHRIRLFRDTARVFRVPNELFAENSWTQVMLGQGIVPSQHHPVGELMNDRELNDFLERIRTDVERAVASLPAHEAYVRDYCAEAMPA